MPQPERADRIKASQPYAVWEPYLWRGKLTLLDGPPGVGKTTILCDLAARLSRGDLDPRGQRLEKQRVLMVITEDDVEDAVVPRLQAAEADLSRIGIRRSRLSFDSPEFESLLKDWPVVMLETLLHHFPEGTRHNEESSVRLALEAMTDRLRDSKAACIACKHWNKKQTGLMNRGSGSIAYNAVARVVISAAPVPHQSYSQLIATKVSPKAKPLPLLYEMRTAAANGAPFIKWLGEGEADSLEHTPQVARAIKFIQQLFESREWMLAKEAKASIEAAGITRHTAERAMAELGILSHKMLTKHAPWIWVKTGPRLTGAKRQHLIERCTREWESQVLSSQGDRFVS